MICLGIEGTAHTCGVGIVDENANVLANEVDMYRAAQGGIQQTKKGNI